MDKYLYEESFVEFWRRFNIVYRQTVKTTGPETDEVEIYFDNKIGIVIPEEPKKPDEGGKGGGTHTDGRPSKYNIIKEIEWRNKQEEEIQLSIEAFEKQIDELFDFINKSEAGKRLIAKIKKDGNSFSNSEKPSDFTRIYQQYTLVNKSKLSLLFLSETKGNQQQLFDDFEKSIMGTTFYEEKDSFYIAAEPDVKSNN